MMKLLTSFFLLVVFLLQTGYSQKCSYKVNDIDKFTKLYTKITKSEKVIGTFYTTGEFSARKIDTSFSFIFDYVLSSYSNFEPYSINKGSELIFLLENGELIKLKSADNIRGTKKVIRGLPSVYSCYLTNVCYPVTKSEIDQLFNSKINSIRFFRTESNGKEDYIDNEIKKKNQDDIQDLIKCVL